MFVPIAGFVVAIIVAVDLAKAFSRDGGFAILLILLPFVGFPLLGFSQTAVYRGPVADPMYQYAMYAQYGYPPPSAYPPPGMYPPPQAYPQPPGYPPPGYQPPGYPPAYPPPGYPPQQAYPHPVPPQPYQPQPPYPPRY